MCKKTFKFLDLNVYHSTPYEQSMIQEKKPMKEVLNYMHQL